MKIQSQQHRRSLLALASPILAALVLGITFPTAFAAPAAISSSKVGAATTISARYLSSPAASLTTTTGKKLLLSVNGAWSVYTKNTASVDVDLLKHLSASTFPTEGHDWNFSLTGSSFTNNSAGRATLSVTAKQIGWYGHMSLTFTPKSHAAQSCKSGSGVIYTGTITGSIDFNTNQKPKVGWGSVNKSKVSWPKSSLILSSGCIPKVPTATPTCSLGITWSSPTEIIAGGASQEFGGSSLHSAGSKVTSGSISAFRTVNSTVNGTPVTRADSDLDLSPISTLTAATGTVKITGGSKAKPPGGTLISGAVQLAIHMSPPAVTQPGATCKQSGKTTTQCYTSYFASSSPSKSAWINGKPALSALMSVGGNVTQPNKSGTGDASGSITSYSVGCK